MEMGKKEEETEQARDEERYAESNQRKCESTTPNRDVKRKEEERDNCSNKSSNRIQETGTCTGELERKNHGRGGGGQWTGLMPHKWTEIADGTLW